jgi:hypothetical protein
METLKNEAPEKCIYLLKEMQACTLRPDGLYIPPRIHMLTYCQTGNYKNCPTYERYCPMESQNMLNEIKEYGGRRRFFRIPKKHTVLIQTCDSIGTVIGSFTEQALTLDYSQGGMRIQLENEPPADSLLRFDFGNDFIVPQLQGIAKICWHRQQPDNPQGLEAGLVFKDHFSQAVLAVQCVQ